MLAALAQVPIPLCCCRHGASLPRPPQPFRDAQLRRLQAPTLLLAAELDFLGGGAAAAERAWRVFPRCEAYILRGAKHFIGAHWVREATHRVAGFFYGHGLMQPHAVVPRPRLQPAPRGAAGPAAAGAEPVQGSTVTVAVQTPPAGKAVAGQAASLPAAGAKPAPRLSATPALRLPLAGAAEKRLHEPARPGLAARCREVVAATPAC